MRRAVLRQTLHGSTWNSPCTRPLIKSKYPFYMDAQLCDRATGRLNDSDARVNASSRVSHVGRRRRSVSPRNTTAQITFDEVTE